MRVGRPLFLLLASAAALLLLGGPAVAAGEGPARQPQPQADIRISANDVIGRAVKSPGGEAIGAVDDLLIAENGIYAIVSVGGFLGVGDKLVAVRYRELQPGPGDALVLEATRQELERRIAFEYRDAAAGGGQAAGADSRREYEKSIGERIDSWTKKVSELTSDAAREGEQAGRQAADKVGTAWDQVQAQWGRLKNASAEAWDGTKAAFEQAWSEFRRAWRDATET